MRHQEAYIGTCVGGRSRRSSAGGTKTEALWAQRSRAVRTSGRSHVVVVLAGGAHDVAHRNHVLVPAPRAGRELWPHSPASAGSASSPAPGSAAGPPARPHSACELRRARAPQVAQQLHLAQRAPRVHQVLKGVGDLLDGHLLACMPGQVGGSLRNTAQRASSPAAGGASNSRRTTDRQTHGKLQQRRSGARALPCQRPSTRLAPTPHPSPRSWRSRRRHRRPCRWP